MAVQAAGNREPLQHFSDKNEQGMTRAVKNSEIAAAATMAMVIESSIVIRRAMRLANASR